MSEELTFLSGHCNPSNPEEIHRQCHEQAASPKGTLRCRCDCHLVRHLNESD